MYAKSRQTVVGKSVRKALQSIRARVPQQSVYTPCEYSAARSVYTLADIRCLIVKTVLNNVPF